MNPSAEALVLTGPNMLEHRRFDLPDVTADTTRLRIEACGLCGTDHEQYSGHIAAPFSFIPGHEIVGIIDEIGDTAAGRWNVAAGDRVAVEVFRSCRQCEPCARGEYRRCVRNGLATMFGFVDAQIAPGLWGGYATHLHLPSDAMLLPIPDSLDPVLATVFNPLGAGIRWGATIPETKSGDVVVVLGPGIRGLCAAVAAKEAGASFVALTGLGPRDRDRLDIAHRFGVDLAIDVAVDDPTAALKPSDGWSRGRRRRRHREGTRRLRPGRGPGSARWDDRGRGDTWWRWCAWIRARPSRLQGAADHGLARRRLPCLSRGH